VSDDQEIYVAVGGDAPFFELVERFYDRVEDAPALRGLYPEDLAPGKEHLAWFLIQRFGGPNYFNERRGAPMLRRRHAEFAIDFEMRDLWFDAMMAAVDSVADFSPYRTILNTYFADAATFLINKLEPKVSDRALRSL
jgi:hemoglobin